MDKVLSIIYNFILKNRQILPRARTAHAQESFNFQKITGNFCCWKFQFVNNFLIGPQNGQNGFWPAQKKKKENLFSFSSFWAFKQTKEQNLFLAQSLKISNNIFVCADFRVTLRHCAKWKSNISYWNFGFGVPQQFSTTWHVSKKSIHPSAGPQQIF